MWLQAGVDEGERTRQRHASVMYEVVKTRAFVAWIAATQLEAGEVENMIVLAEEAARDYVRERGL